MNPRPGRHSWDSVTLETIDARWWHERDMAIAAHEIERLVETVERGYPPPPDNEVPVDVYALMIGSEE